MGIKKKRNKAERGAPGPGYSLPIPPPNRTGIQESGSGQGMTIDAILGQLSSLKDNALSFLDKQQPDSVWQADIDACDAAAAILTALQAESIKDPEQVWDLISDYNALAAQYQKLHQKYEQGRKAERLGGSFLCPNCHRKTHPGSSYCWNCGLRIDWG